MRRITTTAALAALLLTAAPTVAQASVPVGNQATAMVSAAPVSAVKKKAKHKPVTVVWTTIKRSSVKAPLKGRGIEVLRVPHLKNASAKATKAFDAAVSAKVRSVRSGVQAGRGSMGCSGKVDFRMSALQSGVYAGRYASASFGIDAEPGCGGAHGWDFARSVAIDLKTGKSVSLKSFLTNTGRAPVKSAQQQMRRKHAWSYPETYRDLLAADAWTVTSKGVGLSWASGNYGAYSQGFFSVSLPWSVARR